MHWSITEMEWLKQFIKHPLIWEALLVLLMIAALASCQESPVPPEALGDLPKVEPLTQKGYTETIPGSQAKFELVPIPGGSYVMGSPDGEAGRSKDEGLQHPVTIRPFWMGKLEVTWDEYDIWREDEKAVIGAGKGDEKKGRKVDADAITRP